MLVTVFALWLVVTEGLQLTAWLLLATFVLDLAAWSALENIGEAWATGERREYDWDDES